MHRTDVLTKQGKTMKEGNSGDGSNLSNSLGTDGARPILKMLSFLYCLTKATKTICYHRDACGWPSGTLQLASQSQIVDCGNELDFLTSLTT